VAQAVLALRLQLQEHPLQERVAAAGTHKTQLQTLVAWAVLAAAAMALTALTALERQIPVVGVVASTTQTMDRLVVREL
jgi:hypothetical protein